MILHLHLKTQSKFDRIEKKDNVWLVSIRAKPKDNEANEYLLRFLSEILELQLTSIRIKRGHKSRIKQIEILEDGQRVFTKLKPFYIQ